MGLVVAARYLTIVPFPGRMRSSAYALGHSAPWFPVIGLGIGVILTATDRMAQVFFPLLLAGLITVTVWKLLTGGLHLDGLADCLDGLGGRDAEHRLAIMRDSRIAAFGAGVGALATPIALSIALVAAIAALRVLGLAVFAVSVSGALVATWFFAARVSGITGDVLGAAIEIAELAGLLTVSAWSHLER